MEQIQKLIDSSDNGRLMKEGVKTVIVGKPNAGKSSLLNSLLGEERAIVTDIAGTTRDVLTETIQLNGITLNVTDTAGIRQTEDYVEQIGVKKAKETMETADLIIYVVDSSTRIDENDEKIIEALAGRKAVVLQNKTDLPTVTSEEELKKRIPDHQIIPISAKDGSGIDQLEQYVKELFYQGEISFNDQVFITNVRQKYSLIHALESLKQVENSISMQMPEDFFSIDLMNAYEELGEITGETVGEDLVNEIFGKFCMGK